MQRKPAIIIAGTLLVMCAIPPWRDQWGDFARIEHAPLFFARWYRESEKATHLGIAWDILAVQFVLVGLVAWITLLVRPHKND